MPTFKYYNGSAWVALKAYYNHHMTLTCSRAVLNIDLISSDSSAFTALGLYTAISTYGGRLPVTGYIYDRDTETDCPILQVIQYVSGRDRYIRVQATNIDSGSNETYDIPTTLYTSITDSVNPI